MTNYLYQIFMRNGTTEYGILLNFDFSLMAYLPLGTVEKLSNSEYQIPFSFIYGENDWTRVVDEDYGKNCVEAS